MLICFIDCHVFITLLYIWCILKVCLIQYHPIQNRGLYNYHHKKMSSLIYIAYINFTVYIKVLFTLLKCNSNNEHITIIYLLVISILLTLFFAFLSANLKRSPFKLSLLTILFLLSKIFLIFFIIIRYATDIHLELMEYILHVVLTYVIPLVMGNELLALSMNGPVSGGTHSTGTNSGNNGNGSNGGNNGNGNNGGNVGGNDTRPTTLPLVPGHTKHYTYDNDTKTFKINDPHSVVKSTGGRYDFRMNYDDPTFFKNLTEYLIFRRAFGITDLGNIDQSQLKFIKGMREHHFNHVECPGVARQFDPNLHKYNTKKFIT